MIILEYPKEYPLKFPIKDNIVLRFIKETHTPLLGLCWISYYYSIIDFEKKEIIKEFNEDINLSQFIKLTVPIPPPRQTIFLLTILMLLQ